MNAVYESGLTLVRDESKQKGYQAIFNEFVESTLNTTTNIRRGGSSGSIDVSLDQPVIDQLWICVNQIIKQINLQMRSFMAQFGVTSESLSPFFKSFETPRSLLDEVKNYMGKAKIKNDEVAVDSDLRIPEIDANGGAPTLETIQNLISKVQEKGDHIEESSTSKDSLITDVGI